MAKRTTRQSLVDKLESAAAATERAEDLLAQASTVYYDNGKHIGALLDQIREGLKLSADTIRRFRREYA